jgi:hypothetical protein
METMFDRVEKTAGTQLTKMRWALGVNGITELVVKSDLKRAFTPPKPQPST